MQRIDRIFAALGDPMRLTMLERLAQGEATVTELAEPLPISQPAVSRHIKVLVDAGLVQRRVDGTARPCRLAPAALGSIDSWLRKLRDTMEKNYSRLAGQL